MQNDTAPTPAESCYNDGWLDGVHGGNCAPLAVWSDEQAAAYRRGYADAVGEVAP